MAEGTATTSWSDINLSGFFSSNTEDTVESINGFIATLADISALVTTTLDLISNFIFEEIDGLKEVILVLVAAIDAAIFVFTETSIKYTYHAPTSTRTSKNITQMLSVIANSFDDKFDKERPISSSNDNHFLLWTALTVEDTNGKAYEKILNLINLFGFQLESAFNEDESLYKQALAGGSYPPTTSKGQGQAPNWSSISLSDMTPFSEFVLYLSTIKASILTGSSNKDQLLNRIELIGKRIKVLSDTSNKITQLLDKLSSSSETFSDVHILSISGKGDSDVQKKALLDATNAPDYPFKGLIDNSATGCFTLQAQSGLGGVLEVLRGLLSVQHGSTSKLVRSTEILTEGI